MQPLTPPATHYLLAAQGWIELGNYLEANAELEKICPLSRIHPDVLEIHCQICANGKKWDACVVIASTLVKLAPDRPAGRIQRSFALNATRKPSRICFRSLKSFRVSGRFPTTSPAIAPKSDFDDAKHWFKKAILIDDKTVQRAAIDDPDLKPLWGSMSTPI